MESAIQRVPVELWQEIIEYALVSPLIPHQDDSILKGRLVFAQKCEAEAIIRAHQRHITRCRLVSRAWNAIALPLQTSGSVITCDGHWYTSAMDQPSHLTLSIGRKNGMSEARAASYFRIEVVESLNSCYCKKAGCRFRQRIGAQAQKFQETEHTGPSAMARLCTYITSTDPPAVPDFSTDVYALSFFIPPASDGMRKLLQRPVFTQMTHLNCPTTVSHFQESFRGVLLPNLHFLRLDGPMPGDRFQHSLERQVEGPHLPRLKHLCIAAPIDPTQRGIIIVFLRSCSATLVSMIWESQAGQLRHWRNPFDLTTEFWATVPHVTTFGFYPEVLFFARRTVTIKAMPTPPSPTSDASTSGLHLILPYSPTIKSILGDQTTRLDEIAYLVDRWRVNQITLSEVTWGDLKRHVLGFHLDGRRANLGCAPCFARFFETMKRSGVRVLDANGEASTEGHGAKYVRLLDGLGFDGIDVERSTWAE